MRPTPSLRGTLSALFVFVIACPSEAIRAAPQRAGKRPVLGVYEPRVGLLNPVLREGLSYYGRELKDLDLALHRSVPVALRLLQGRSPSQFQVEADPKIGVTRLTAPCYINLDLRYSKQLKRPHRFALKEHRGKVFLMSHTCLELRLGDLDVVFVDANHDGAFGGPADQYLAKPRSQGQWLKPGEKPRPRNMGRSLEVGGQSVYFAVDSRGARVLVSNKAPDFSHERYLQAQDALTMLNKMRRRAGVPELVLDEDLSKACEARALYSSLNGETTPLVKGKPGFSVAARAVLQYCSQQRAGTLPAAMQVLRHSFFQRVRLLNPRAQRVGLGFVGGVAAVAVPPGRPRPGDKPVLWPPPDAKDVPTTWQGGDRPSPLGTAASFEPKVAQRYGYPISVTFAKGPVTDVSASLCRGEGSRRDQPVDIVLRSPEKPAHRLHPHNLQSILIMGQDQLQAGATYLVAVRGKHRGKEFKLEWQFSTR